MLLHPAQVEQDLEKVEAAYRGALLARKLDGWSDPDPNPLVAFRPRTTKERFEQVRLLPSELPNKDDLLRWQAALTIERVTWHDRAVAEIARHDPQHIIGQHIIADMGSEPWSVSSLITELMRASDASRRSRIAGEITRASSEASSSAIRWALRRHAAARELGLESIEWLEAPVQGIDICSVARFVLDATNDIALGSIEPGSDWGNSLWAGFAMDAQRGWPASLTPRWFRTVFGNWKVLDGLRIESGPLCEALCGASFARALARFGAAVERAVAARSARAGTSLAGTFVTSFATAKRPFDMRQSSYGALFASLLTSVPFLKRHLGLGAGDALEHARSMGRSVLIATRLSAAQATVASASASSADAFVDAHVSSSERALLASVPSETAGVVPRYNPMAGSRLCGALHAAKFQQELINQFDEDWFDNPRGQECLASLDVRERMVLTDGGARDGVLNLQKTLSELLLR